MNYNKFLYSVVFITVSGLLCLKNLSSMPKKRVDQPGFVPFGCVYHAKSGICFNPTTRLYYDPMTKKWSRTVPVPAVFVPAAAVAPAGAIKVSAKKATEPVQRDTKSEVKITHHEDHGQEIAARAPVLAEAPDMFDSKKYLIIAQQQLVQTIFILMQAPWSLEERAYALCYNNKKILLEQHSNPGTERINQAIYRAEVVRQNFNPCLFRAVQEYEKATKSCDLSLNRLSVAHILDCISALFLLYTDDGNGGSDLITYSGIDFGTLQKYQKLYRHHVFGRTLHERELRVPDDILNFLVETNTKIIRFFLETLDFKKPKFLYVFHDVAPDQAAYQKKTVVWRKIQALKMGKYERFTFTEIDDPKAIEKPDFLCYRRQELFNRACNDHVTRSVLIEKLKKLFGIPEVPATGIIGVTKELACLKIA